ncbi:hypothetical protein [Stenotrophomonas sp. GD03958]|uniref:hypothetical protein n=1 Tax=Stenotrophomonas sp. GD03958 TaxID=2975411 RepID=UPI00244D758B|nr:hypothetical protein [Stenotrophomonas sp. GD03958]MDH1192496.1 hypothetical protein [Stenotrophomonas sp. GD03958]
MNRKHLRVLEPGENPYAKTRPLETGDGGGNDSDMRERLAKLEAILPSLASKGDIGELRADFERGQKENRAWMLATVLALFAGILGAGGLVLTALKPSNSAASQAAPAAPAPQPIIIQIPPQLQPEVPAPAPAAAATQEASPTSKH